MVSGVAQVNIFGSQKFAVRVDVDPRELAARSIGIDEVASAIQNANVNLPTGTIYGERTFVVQTNGQLMRASAYGPTIIAYRNGMPGPPRRSGARLRRRRERQDRELAERRALHLPVDPEAAGHQRRRRSWSAIKALLPAIREQLPASVTLDVRSDRSVTIRESVHDVKLTLMITVALVVLVIFIFLRNISATIIPSLALPCSLVGTFAVMYLLGYSLDNLSLMALTLSVGFVVDDAIVMLENIVRHMEMGKTPMQAAFDGSKESGVHDSVDDGVARGRVHPGAVHGRHRRPAAARVRGDDRRGDSDLGLRLDQPDADAVQPLPAAAARRSVMAVCTTRSSACSMPGASSTAVTLRVSLRYRAVTTAVSVVLLVVTVYLFIAVPKGFLPSEDQGRFNVNTEGAQGISFDEMVQHQLQVADIVLQDPNVASAGVNVGLMGNNATGGSNTGPHVRRAEAARRARR